MKKFFEMNNTFSADAMNTSANCSCAKMDRVNFVAMANCAIAFFVLSIIRIIDVIIIGKSQYRTELQGI